MKIWQQTFDLAQLNQRGVNTLVETLDIQFTDYGDDYLTATMPVDHTTKQPEGILHGGASCVLAESIGSVAANLCVDMSKYYCVGVEINASHMRQVNKGRVTGIATPIRIGHKVQVWEIKIYKENQILCCISRLTLMVLAR